MTDDPNPAAKELPRSSKDEHSDPHYKFLTSLIGSSFAMAMYEEIQRSDLSARCKSGGFKVIIQLFDQNAMLAKATPQELSVRYVNAEKVLTMWVLECNESDIRNPAYPNIVENIMNAYKDFINRPGERDGLLKTESHVKYEGLNPSTPSTAEPRSGIPFLGRR